MLFRNWTFSLLCLFLWACTPKTQTTTGSDQLPETDTPESVATTSSVLEGILQPNEEGIPYPIYASFDQVAPLLDQKDDRTYLINFWATWCQPCVAELPYFEQLAENKKDVSIVMVSLDFQRDVRTKLRRFIETRPFNLPVVALTDTDYNAWLDQVDQRWNGAIPVTIAYRNGKRKFHNEQLDSYEELAEMVEAVR